MKRLIIALFIMIFAVSCGDSGSKPSDASSVDIKTVTKGFIDQLKEEHKGKVMIVNFFASWCPPCRGETPDFVEAYNKNKDNNFVIVGLSLDKKPSDAAKFLDEFKVTYPVYIADNALGSEMSISTIPTSLIYKPDGKLFDIVVGPLTAKELDIIAGSFKE
ncbi:Redoxin domain protein [Denitrovibrio acetiphilus DSM 12809]|jgi:thiol-disulfide isomerase/thioredoxin|uniref:Redoxin domain protein n=1 Tax=Denitrovibrio acetiphilus (strain DSM 12809 / NBRC 114555 / N2460) TaxID=522772 RepID=D4H3V6_DENA2|nr:TlpA disulfide reductase family protein [Denitrovibrio acetiphilus]ADD69208.1 Redoxin domain protein [Denitrovibrio acetiphilus DSM 12809]